MLLSVLMMAALTGVAVGDGTRYGFYRSPDAAARRSGGGGGSRRVFGGRSASPSAWGAACALLDRYWATRCSAAVVAPRWALTAAHCVSPHVAYVKYNARRPAAPEGDAAPVHYLYRHPGYKVVQTRSATRGADVTLLHHDVGLVRTRADMRLDARPALPPLSAMTLYDPMDLRNEEVEVLGFGRSETSPLGEELLSARLRLVECERGAWFHCVCGASASGAARAGVCAGDSGGPVIYRGAQVGVTSMGPVSCGAGEPGEPGGTSVFTALARYAALINCTVHSAEAALRMERVSRAPPAPRAPRTTLTAAAAAVATVAAALLHSHSYTPNTII